MTTSAPRLILACILGCVSRGGRAAPPALVVTDEVARPAEKVPPLGVNHFGRAGGTEWARNNFIHNPGNEPIHWRDLHRAVRVGPGWLELDGGGTSGWGLWASGLSSGAGVRIYRLVDARGRPLPPSPATVVDASRADRVELVGRARVRPRGSRGLPDGGWVANRYTEVHPHGLVRHGNLAATDASGVENGRSHWYVVVAIGPDGQASARSREVEARPRRGLDLGPRLGSPGPRDELPTLYVGAPWEWQIPAYGGRAPLAFSIDAAMPLPEGLRVEGRTGRVSGLSEVALDGRTFRVEVVDADGRSARRTYGFGPPPPPRGEAATPAPPRALRAVAGDGLVHLTWEASPSPDVVGYRVERSTAPAARQEERVYLDPGAPKLRVGDYVVVEHEMMEFDMRGVSPRVRGIGNPMDAPHWPWVVEGDVELRLAPHARPPPKSMLEPGRACLQVTFADGEGAIHQRSMVSPDLEGENLWYVQLEPGKRYRWDGWLRREGLVDGEVRLSLGAGYPDLVERVEVGTEWTRFAWEFLAPGYPKGIPWHFGPRLTARGPGKLWLEGLRLFRSDRPDERDAPYHPGPLVLDELVASQPATGPKGALRMWFLDRHATMDGILSWYPNSRIEVDWSTSIMGTLEMTLPAGLEFARRTGAGPGTRMRPWIVLQHILHDEADWHALVEWLAAPFDPERDAPSTKPHAHRRVQQRGVTTPWIEEFEEIVIELGNETWHNGAANPDWLGFSRRDAVHQGGREYGLFARYLIGLIRKSPHWGAGDLDRKIKFALGGNYEGEVDARGEVHGYAEEAARVGTGAAFVAHANYVGPRWEAGEEGSTRFDDRGVQAALLSWVAGPAAAQAAMARARDALARKGVVYDLVAYEGGPSGYALPWQASPEQVEVNERYGKSLALGVGAFDAWLGSYLLGWTHQCFLGFGQGTHWNSHTLPFQGFRASPAWLALKLRNRVAHGDMMRVQALGIPTLTWDGEDHPTIGGYAFRDREASRWTVFVVSRSLAGLAGDGDGRDGADRLELRLPFRRARAIRLHRLAGDPRANNREREAIALVESAVDARALVDGRLVVEPVPRGGVLGFVFEGAEGRR